jgi:hypothetical protein
VIKFDPVECPFCGEKDFDKVGLKIHLTRGHCEKYEEIDIFNPFDGHKATDGQ